MKDPQSLGDTPPVEFRKQLHALADWIADFRENIETLRVAPNEKPGVIRRPTPKACTRGRRTVRENSQRRR